MKVALIFLHPFSESMGSFVRIRELSLSLGKFGAEVFIFTPFERCFDLSARVHVVSMANAFGLSRDLYGLSKFLYYNRIFPTLFSKGGLWLEKVSGRFLRRLADFLCKNRVDVVQAEQDVALPVGVFLKEATGLPLVVDLHNLSSEELVAAGVLERNSTSFFKLQFETSRLLRRADRIVVVSELMRDYVVNNYGLSKACVAVVPPGGRVLVDESIVEERVKPFKVVYAGLVSYRERVDLLVRSIPFVEGSVDGGVQFYITNKGDFLKEVKRLAGRLGVCPKFFWFDDYNRVNDFLLKCHIGVLPSSNDLARKMGTPVKLFNYMSLGLPVVANDIGSWSKIIEEEEIGLLTKDDPESFASAINTLLNNEELRIRASRNALHAIRSRYNWETSAKSLVEVYEDIL